MERLKPIVYFRADENSQIGLGHVIRSLALAEMITEAFDCRFIIRNPLPALATQIKEVCTGLIVLPETEDSEQEARHISETILSGKEIVVLDGYQFRTDYQKIIKRKGCKLVCIDDIHAYHFVADVVINHAPGIDPGAYEHAPYTRLCLGLDYSLLRAPFLEAARTERHFDHIETVFVSMGGSDLENLTLRVLERIVGIAGIDRVAVVLGAANAHRAAIEAFAHRYAGEKVDIYQNLSVDELVSCMRQCHLGITAASSMLFELTAVKMPVISGYYVDNQKDVYEGFLATGMIYGAGDLRKTKKLPYLIREALTKTPCEILARQHRHQHGQSRNHLLKLFYSLCHA